MSAQPHPSELVLVANARMPSARAQSLQVAQAAGAFARAGFSATLLFARRRDTPRLEDFEHAEERGQDALWSYYALPAGARPMARAVPCFDWIDRVPRALQYAPARFQELTFARAAARVVRREYAQARVLSRELETAHALAGRPGVFLEIHRVPGGRARRRWLLESASSAAGVVAISGGVRDDLIELGIDPGKLRVEHDAYDPARFAAMPSRTEAREALGLDSDATVVVYTGGLLEWKGADLLVEAARELREVNFVIAGGMQVDVEALKERARGLAHVRIDGFQPPARVPLYLAAGDLGVVPNRSTPAISARYTSPLKVFEAMAAGLPLVASDLPSLREVLDEEGALFVTPDRVDTLAEGLRSLIADPGRRAAMAVAQRSRAQGATWDARARRLIEWMDARG